MNRSFYLFSLRSSDHTEWTLQFSSCSNRIEDEAEKERARVKMEVCAYAHEERRSIWVGSTLAHFLCPSDNIAIHRGAVEYVCGARRRKYESITSISVRLAARHIADKSLSCESQLEKVINQSCMHGRVIKTWNSPHTVRCSVVEKMTSIIFDSQSLCSSLGKVDYLIHVGTFRAELSVPSNLVNVLVKRTHDILTQ